MADTFPSSDFALRAWRRAGQARHVRRAGHHAGYGRLLPARPPRDLRRDDGDLAPAAAHRRGVAGRRAQEPRQPGATGRRSRVPHRHRQRRAHGREHRPLRAPGEGEGHRASDDRRLRRDPVVRLWRFRRVRAVPGPVRDAVLQGGAAGPARQLPARGRSAARPGRDPGGPLDEPAPGHRRAHRVHPAGRNHRGPATREPDRRGRAACHGQDRLGAQRGRERRRRPRHAGADLFWRCRRPN